MSHISLTVTYFGELNSQRSVRLKSQLGGAFFKNGSQVRDGSRSDY